MPGGSNPRVGEMKTGYFKMNRFYKVYLHHVIQQYAF